MAWLSRQKQARALSTLPETDVAFPEPSGRASLDSFVREPCGATLRAAKAGEIPHFLPPPLTKSKAAEFKQYRSCVGAGPSSKTCPR